MSFHGCRNEECSCQARPGYDGYCSYECSTGESSRVLEGACPCWHPPCVASPFIAETDTRPRITEQSFAEPSPRAEAQPRLAAAPRSAPR